MRRLADELGVSVTSVYYHVGNREQLVDQLVDELLRAAWFLAPSGERTQGRVLMQLAELRRVLLEHPAVVELASECGRLGALLTKAERQVLRELGLHGVTGDEAAVTARALTSHVLGFVLLERGVGGAPGPASPRVQAERASLDVVFGVNTGALVSELVPA